MKTLCAIIACFLILNLKGLQAQHLINQSVELDSQSKLKLNEKFKKFEILEISLNSLNAKLKSKKNGSNFSLMIHDKVISIEVTENEIRSAKYQITSSLTDLNNSIREACNTYKGRVTNDPKSDIRLTISENMFKGYILTEGQFYYLDRLDKYVVGSEKNMIIAYRAKDIIDRDHKTCAFKVEEEQALINQIESPTLNLKSSASTSCRILELATEAD